MTSITNVGSVQLLNRRSDIEYLTNDVDSVPPVGSKWLVKIKDIAYLHRIEVTVKSLKTVGFCMIHSDGGKAGQDMFCKRSDIEFVEELFRPKGRAVYTIQTPENFEVEAQDKNRRMSDIHNYLYGKNGDLNAIHKESLVDVTH